MARSSFGSCRYVVATDDDHALLYAPLFSPAPALSLSLSRTLHRTRHTRLCTSCALQEAMALGASSAQEHTSSPGLRTRPPFSMTATRFLRSSTRTPTVVTRLQACIRLVRRCRTLHNKLHHTAQIPPSRVRPAHTHARSQRFSLRVKFVESTSSQLLQLHRRWHHRKQLPALRAPPAQHHKPCHQPAAQLLFHPLRFDRSKPERPRATDPSNRRKFEAEYQRLLLQRASLFKRLLTNP